MPSPIRHLLTTKTGAGWMSNRNSTAKGRPRVRAAASCALLKRRRGVVDMPCSLREHGHSLMVGLRQEVMVKCVSEHAATSNNGGLRPTRKVLANRPTTRVLCVRHKTLAKP